MRVRVNETGHQGESGDVHLAGVRRDRLGRDDADVDDPVAHDQNVAPVPGISGPVENLAAPKDHCRAFVNRRRRAGRTGEAGDEPGQQEQAESEAQVVHGVHPTGTAPYTALEI